MTAAPSPCTGVCRLDRDDVCRGCGRTLDEIAEWPTANEERRRHIAAAAIKRIGV